MQYPSQSGCFRRRA